MKRTDRDATRIVRSWLEEGADRIPDRVLDAVQAQLPATHQRRASRLARMWTLLSGRSVGYGIAAAVIVGAAAFGVANTIPRDTGSGPTPEPVAPTPEPTVLPLGDADLAPGSYTLEGFRARIVFDVPVGFFSCSLSVVEQSICAAGGGDRTPPALSFLIVENVVEEPCSDILRDPPPDSVDDFVAAISSLDEFEATAAVDVSIDGFSGKKFMVTAPSRINCDLLTWATPDRTNGVGLGEVNELTILDVDGATVMIAIAHFPSYPPPETLSTLRQIVDSIRISQ
jgi:hypothetical protein